MLTASIISDYLQFSRDVWQEVMVQLDILYLNMYGCMGVTHYISNILTMQTRLEHWNSTTSHWDCLSDKAFSWLAHFCLLDQTEMLLLFSSGGWTVGHRAQ